MRDIHQPKGLLLAVFDEGPLGRGLNEESPINPVWDGGNFAS